jgi:protoporphyrinogen oxidase
VSDLVVVGAGPSGLTVAWRAAQAGHHVRVLDAAPTVGGMAASFEIAGQRVDLGSHRLHPSTRPHLLAELRALLGADLQTRLRNGRLHLRDRWIGFPLRPAELVRRLPPSFAAAALRDAATAPLRRARFDATPRAASGEATFADVVRTGLGPTMLQDFYGPYATKLWGRDPDQLAGELARRRIAASSASSMLRKVARGAQSAKRTFLYPKLGYGQIVERLADAAVNAGCQIELSRSVDDLGDCEADRVVWTAPLSGLVRATRDVPGDVVEAAGRLRHRAMTLVYLVLDQPSYTEFDAHYVPDATVSLTRLSEPKNYRDGPDPRDVTVLCAEVPCAVGDDTWTAPAVELGDRIADDLAQVGLPPLRPAQVEVRRLPSVYPIYTPATVHDLALVDAWASGLPHVTVLGRQGLFVADNLHHVMDMGWSAAEAIGPDGTVDDERWTRERARFATFVVED